jgi:hypothetical protein
MNYIESGQKLSKLGYKVRISLGVIDLFADKYGKTSLRT